MKPSEIREMKRWTTHRKDKAFHIAQRMTDIEPIIQGRKTYWVVGRVIKDRVVFDLDTKDADNLKAVRTYLGLTTNLQYHIIETNSGYHLVSKEIVTKDQREKAYLDFLGVGYTHDIKDWMELKKEARGDKQYTRNELQDIAKQFGHDFKQAGFFKIDINVDLLFIVNSLLRGKSVLRISKKSKDDIYRIV
jgi:hypothetical protein